MIKKRNWASRQGARERERHLLEKTFWTKDKGSTFPFSFKCLDK
jgi:hypothetical protein